MKLAISTLIGVAILCAINDPFTPVAEKLVAAINAGDTAAIEQMFSAEMQQALPEEKTREFFSGLIRERGKITKLGEPRTKGRVAVIRLTCERGAWALQLSLNKAGKIDGLYIVPPAPEIPVPERNATPMRLPFRGEWTVFWGGATREQNYHVNFPNQRRALDIVVRDASGSSSRGDGKRNEDYYCYGKEILTPADGEVVTMIDGVPDNAPGSMNGFSAVGNCVILKHAEREFSVLAHLQPHSIVVKVGDKVRAGQLLGKCGNSGNSSEPHLHFHLQNTAVLQDGAGFAPYFQNIRVTRDGKTSVEKEHTPIKDERIAPAEK